MRLEKGSKLGPYEIISPIGAGGMGEVYLAHDPQLGRDIAVKVLPENVSYGAERLARFENEARLASSLNHPNIITIYSMGWENQRCYIAMELIDGQTLHDLIEEKPIPVEQALKIFTQVADGLARAHEAGIVHRDLKPKNIMVTRDGHAKILDFGLSKLTSYYADSKAPTTSVVIPADDSGGLTKPGTVLGTVEYMSPEQAAGRSVDFRSDQFSMGSLMYTVLTGILPFHRESEIQTMNQIIEGKPRPVDRLNSHVPAPLREVLRRCLMKSPGDRYASTRELAEELKRLETESRLLLRHWTRRDWIRASIGLLILLAVAGFFWVWSHWPYRPDPKAVEWYQEGVAALHSMTFDRARRAFDRAVQMDPKFALAQANLARAYDEMGYSDQAAKQMMQAMNTRQEINLSRMDEKHFDVLQYIVLHQYADAVSLLQQIERDADKQDKPAAALECGWLAEKLNDTEGAAAAYERALQMDPDYAAANLRLGFIHQRLGENDLALQNFTKAENLYRDKGDTEGITESLFHRANLLIRRSSAEQAMLSIEDAIALARGLDNQYQEIRLLILKSAALRKMGKHDEAGEIAQQAFDAALKHRMDNIAASGRMNLGNSFFENGDYVSAEENYNEALIIAQRGKVKHYEALALHMLGSLFEQKNQPEQAIQHIEEALSFYKDARYRRENIQAQAILGGALCQLGSYEKGIEVLGEALPQAIQLQDTGTISGIRDRMIEILQAQGNWPEALKESEEALDRFE
ncbi:MAG: protein kinase, partial [Acidobacteriota bacterium]